MGQDRLAIPPRHKGRALRIYDASSARIAFELRPFHKQDVRAVPHQRLLGQRLLGKPAFPSGILAFLRMVPKVHLDRLTPKYDRRDDAAHGAAS